MELPSIVAAAPSSVFTVAPTIGAILMVLSTVAEPTKTWIEAGEHMVRAIAIGLFLGSVVALGIWIGGLL